MLSDDECWECEEWMLRLICQVVHYHVIEAYYYVMVYILEELMNRGIVEVVLLPIFDLGVYSPYSTRYITYTKKDMEEVLKRYVKWLREGRSKEAPVPVLHIYPKECCYEAVVLQEVPRDNCCIRVLKEAKKLCEKFLFDEKHRRIYERIVKASFTGHLSKHCFDFHEKLEKYSERIEERILDGEDLLLFKITLYLVDAALRGKVSLDDLRKFSYYANYSPSSDDSARDAIEKIFSYPYRSRDEDFWSIAKKHGFEWFLRIWKTVEEYLRKIEELEFTNGKHYPTKTAIEILKKKYDAELEFPEWPPTLTRHNELSI